MPGSDASQFTRFKRANAIQRGDSQQRDSKSVNRLTQYVPRLSGAWGVNNFLSSLQKVDDASGTSGSSDTRVIIITPTDLANGSKTVVVEDVYYTFLNNTGQIICAKITSFTGDTIGINQTFTLSVKPDPRDIGNTKNIQISAGACGGGGGNSKTITITPTDLANGSKSFVVENVIYTYLNNTGVTICLGITKSGVTLLNNGSYTEPDKPDPQDIGLSGSFQISAGTC